MFASSCKRGINQRIHARDDLQLFVLIYLFGLVKIGSLLNRMLPTKITDAFHRKIFDSRKRYKQVALLP